MLQVIDYMSNGLFPNEDVTKKEECNHGKYDLNMPYMKKIGYCLTRC